MTTETVIGPGIFATPPKGARIRDLEPVTHFLQRYQNLKDAQAWRYVEHFKQTFNTLRPEVRGLLATVEEQNRLNAASFNLFRVLHLEAREEEVHTPFLADLLDPRGAHGQKHLFLQAFIDAMVKSHGSFPALEGGIEQHTWFVEPHKYIGRGTLDIVISCPGLSYLLAIDNQIYADDEDDHLERYTRWLEDNRELYDQRTLVCLTPTGEAPGPATCLTASYRGQIAGMLKAALPSISAPHLRESILQYLEIIQKI